MAPPRVIPLLLALLALSVPTVRVAAAEVASAQTVRAALVFNFIKFTEWPAPSGDSGQLRICVASDDPAQIAAFEALDERQIRGIPLAVVRFRRQSDCSVIYVDASGHGGEIADRQTTAHALTIGAFAGFVAEGGMIEISLQEGNVRFDINLPAAKRAGLRFYPQLLRLARHIVE